MKISGAKNTGAWYRANKLIKSLDGSERDALAAILNGLTYADSTWNDITDFAAQTGIDIAETGAPDSTGSWIESMLLNGIPLQIWMGKLSFTTYTLSGAPGARTATPNYQQNVFKFSQQLRKAVRTFSFARREFLDLTNTKDLTTGNPGGLPNIDPTSRPRILLDKMASGKQVRRPRSNRP
jgi:hypothetical protein